MIWTSGEELSEKLNQFKMQFIWAVFSGFDKKTNLDIDNLEVKPYADGNPGFWVKNPKIQHPLAKVEIVCFDSSLTLLLSKDQDLANKFKDYFEDVVDLEENLKT